jgi:DNA-binding XRE family transcriptional regulator
MSGGTIPTLVQTAQINVKRLVRVPPSPNPSVQRRRLTFGQVVRVRRKALGLSQEKLAERAGCDRQSINRVENAAYSPSLDRVFRLADALGVSLSELFSDFDETDAAGSTSGPPGSDRAPAGTSRPVSPNGGRPFPG